MVFFVPFITKDNRAIKERRLKIYVNNAGHCVIEEQFKIKDMWLEDRDGYNSVDFPIDKMLELAEQLKRMEKLLVLK
jgi:uncharacterized protein (UPF0305 family)